MAGNDYSDPSHAEFVLTKNRAFDKSPMTPNNEAVYLFGRVGSTP
jgi:hypothetical protein